MPDPYKPFQPPVWRYEPQSVARARAASEVQQMDAQVSPLVAKGDGLSLAVAQNIVDQTRQGQAQRQLARVDLQNSIGQHVADNIGQPQEGILPDIANAFRAAVPQGVRDVGGGILHTALESGTDLENQLSGGLGNLGVPGFRAEDNGGQVRRSGDIINNALGQLPAGGLLQQVNNVGASPLNLFTAGSGMLGSAAISNSIGGRIAAQTVAGLTGKVGSDLATNAAKNAGAPDWAQLGAGLAGGLVGGGIGLAGYKGVESALSGVGNATDAAALAQAAGPQETSLPMDIGHAVPADNGGTRYIRAVRGAADELPPGVSISPNGIVNQESATGGLLPNLQRTNLIRASKGLPPLTEAPASWPSGPGLSVSRETGQLTPVDALKAQLQSEGKTPQEIAADPRFQQLAAEVFANTPAPWEQPPPPVEEGSIGQRIGQAIIDKATGGSAAPGSTALPDAAEAGAAPVAAAGGGGSRPPSPPTAPPPPQEPGMPSGLTPEEQDAVRRWQSQHIDLSKIGGSGLSPEEQSAVAAWQQRQNAPPPLGTPQGAGVENPYPASFENSPLFPFGTPQPRFDAEGNPIGMQPTLGLTTPGVPTPPITPAQHAELQMTNRVGEAQAIPTGEAFGLPARGRQLGMGIETNEPLPRGSLWQNVKDALTAPRELMASGDISASTRQAGMAAPSHPRAWVQAMKDQIAALKTPEDAQAVMDRIDASPWRPASERAGLQILSAGSNNPLTQEEAFQHGSSMVARAIERVPLVARTERAYTTALNSFRQGLFEDIMGSRFTPEQAAQLPDDYLKEIGSFVNAITGRGDIPSFLADHSQALNSLFFSPRNFFGKVQANLAVFSRNPVVRQEAAKSLAAFYGTGTAILAAAATAGLTVGTNPTSSDFGKIVLPGGTRIDVWGGNAQLFRMLAQVATGQTTSIRSGQTYSQDRLDTVMRFLRNKLAPVPGQAVSIATGSNSAGQELSPDAGNIAGNALGLVTPLFLQDLYSALTNAGPAEGVIAGTASAVGLGAQTYQRGPLDIAAQQKYGTNYAKLTPTQQSELIASTPGLAQQAVQEQAKSAGPAGQAAQAKINAQAQQQASDDQLMNGQLTVQQWQQQRSDRLTRERGALQQIYGTQDTAQQNARLQQQAQTDPKALYLLALNQSIDPATGALDQAKLSAFRASLDSATNAAIDRAMGTSGTPLEQEYRKAAAQFFSTPKYIGYTGQEGSAIDKIVGVVQNYARLMPGDKNLNEQRVFRQLQSSGQFDGVPSNVMTGARRALMGALPQSTQRPLLLRTNPVISYFFGSQLLPGQYQRARTELSAAMPALAFGGTAYPLSAYAKEER